MRPSSIPALGSECDFGAGSLTQKAAALDKISIFPANPLTKAHLMSQPGNMLLSFEEGFGPLEASYQIYLPILK